MKNFLIDAIITQTSNKQDSRFVGGEPRKSAYLKADEKNSAILVEQGFTEYSSVDKDTGEEVKFFIIKTAEKVKVYVDAKSSPKVLGGAGVEGVANFSSNDKVVKIDIIQGENKGNKFSRLSSILDPNGFVSLNEAKNPFFD